MKVPICLITSRAISAAKLSQKSNSRICPNIFPEKRMGQGVYAEYFVVEAIWSIFSRSYSIFPNAWKSKLEFFHKASVVHRILTN